jgi:hypothetical protein
MHIAAGIPRKRAVSRRLPGTCPNSRRRVHWGAMLGDSIAVLTEGRSYAVVLATSYRTLSAAPGGASRRQACGGGGDGRTQYVRRLAIRNLSDSTAVQGSYSDALMATVTCRSTLGLNRVRCATHSPTGRAILCRRNRSCAPLGPAQWSKSAPAVAEGMANVRLGWRRKHPSGATEQHEFCLMRSEGCARCHHDRTEICRTFPIQHRLRPYLRRIFRWPYASL